MSSARIFDLLQPAWPMREGIQLPPLLLFELPQIERRCIADLQERSIWHIWVVV
jgi:hypothetical protein